MKLPPLRYNFRSLLVRRATTILTVISIGATVAVLAGIQSLQKGFLSLFDESGREGVAVFLRPGAGSEGESAFTRDRADILMKTLPEIASGPDGLPLASGELFLAVRMPKVDGGETNVPIRGVQTKSFDITGDLLTLESGRRFEAGTDEIIVGRKLLGRILGAAQDDVIVLNTTPFRVVGVFDYDGPFNSEIWGDADRLQEALKRRIYSRVIATLKPGVDIAALSARLENHKEVPAKVLSEKEYLSTQTGFLSGILNVLAYVLGGVMGIAAIFTGTNTMLAALSSRTKEIGILLALGFRPWSVFLSFLMEAMLLGLIGGAVGCLLVLPLSGIETGTTNFDTFTEIAFAFQVTPTILGNAVLFAMLLGIIGGSWPAYRAARMRPSAVIRRG